MNADRIICLLTAGAAALVAVGCGPAESTGETRESLTESSGTAMFEPGVGLKIPAETRAAMALAYGEVKRSPFIDRHIANARCLGEGPDGSGHHLRAAIAPVEKPMAGAAMLLRSPGGGGELVPVRLLGVDDQLSAVDGSVELLVAVDGAGAAKTGRAVELVYPTGPARTSPGVPAAAVVRAALGEFVYEDVDGFLCRRRVTLGAVNDGRVEIRSGLREGARVVVRGARQLWILELALVGGMGNLEDVKEAR